MPDRAYTEWEVYLYRMGESDMTREQVEALTPKRDRATAWDRLNNSDAIYKRCQICSEFMSVNNWDDRKPRTPRFKDFVICVSCDPRHPADYYEKTHYRILHKRRVRVVQMAQVIRALSKVEDPFSSEEVARLVAVAKKFFADG